MPIEKSKSNRTIYYLASIIAASVLLVFMAKEPGRPEGAPTTEPTADTQSTPVARYEALGDSITFGIPMAFRVDRLGHPRKATTHFQGWPALLGQMLAEKTGTRIEIFNNGYPGNRVGEFRI